MLFAIIIFFMLVGWYVSSTLKKKFRRYAQIPLHSGMSGEETAIRMLRDHGIYDVQITCTEGRLTDHYNPYQKTVNLSEEVYHGRNASAVAVAAHECGHAIQHANAYAMFQLRSTLVPIQNVSSKILNFIFIASFFGGMFLFGGFNANVILPIIIVCYTVITLLGLITLPVEMDASKRALAWIEDKRIVNSQEYTIAKDALKWAGLTYVVSALGSLVLLLYYVLSYLGNRD